MFYSDRDEEQNAAVGDGLQSSWDTQSVLGGGDTTDSSSETYEQKARDLIHSESQYEVQLKMLVSVFRRAFKEALPRQSQVRSLFIVETDWLNCVSVELGD